MHLRVGETLSNREISRMFDVGVQKGIRYSGSVESKVNHVVLITAMHKTPQDLIRNPYQDRKTDDRLFYTGEGRFGDQEMTRGNLVLKQQMERNYPVYAFEKRSPGKYVFLGRFEVLSVQNEIQKDSEGKERQAFLFELHKLEPQFNKANSILLTRATIINGAGDGI